jgi:hypothetical protein
MNATAIRRPVAWQIHPSDVTRFTQEGQHCETRRCRQPAEICTWRWWNSTEAGRILLTEHMVCQQHGQDFADRHHITIDPAPDRPSRHAQTSRGLNR